MTTTLFGAEEGRVSGFSHKCTVTYADLTAAATTQTIDLVTSLPVGALVDSAAFFLETAFSGGAATNLTVQVGWDADSGTDDPGGLIAATEVNAAGTEVLASDATGAAFATLRTGYAFTVGGKLTALFTATGANVNTITAGKIHIFFGITKLADLV